METVLLITELLHIHKIELFLNNVISTLNEKNDFMKFFPRNKLTRKNLPTDQQIMLDIARIVVENQQFEGTFLIDIFDTTLLHFTVKLRQGQSGYVLTLDLNKKNSMFPTANIICNLQTRQIESKPYVFADLDSPPQFDPTLLNTFLANKSFNIQLNVPLTDIQFQS